MLAKDTSLDTAKKSSAQIVWDEATRSMETAKAGGWIGPWERLITPVVIKSDFPITSSKEIPW